MKKIADKVKPTLLFLLAWAFLNVLMNVRYPARGHHWAMLLQISPEVLGVLFFILVAAWMRLRFHTAIYLPLTAVFILLRLFRIGDIMVPMYFFRPFNLFIDSQFLTDLIHLLYTTSSFKAFVLASMFASALLFGITWAVWKSLKTLHHYLLDRRNRSFALGLIIVILMVMQYLPAVGDRIHTNIIARSFLHRIVEEFDFILHAKGYREQRISMIEEAIKKEENIPSSLDKLENADVV